MDQIDWNAIIPAAFVALAGLISGRWVWSKLPKKDMGAAALASVNAAKAAVALADQIHEERLAQLEERVSILEQLVIEKDVVIAQQNEKIRELEKEIDLLLRWIASLSEQLTQEGIRPVGRGEAENRRRW